jgi:hypothetical protein
MMLVSVPTCNGLCCRFVLLSPRSCPTGRKRRLSFQSHKQTVSKKVGLTRNRTRSTTKSNSFPSPETHTFSLGERCSGPPMRGEKRGKTDPRVRFLVKSCATSLKLFYAFISLITVSMQPGQAPFAGDCPSHVVLKRSWYWLLLPDQVL